MTKNETFEDVCHEAEQRLQRRKFLVVFGLSEATGSQPERQRTDSDTIKSTAMRVGLNNFEPTDIRRIGKSGISRPRLLRFKCSDIRDKRFLLSESTRLRNDTLFAHAFISPDQTCRQRARNRELREELKRRRAADEDVII